MMYGSTQQSYAGPVNSGDMVVKNDQVSPGIAALLRKQNARGAQGIFQLPDTQQPNPDFYNQSLMNVQNQIKGQADTLNAMAPEGESLAYINPQEAGILKLLGGAGEPEPVTGIPSYYTPGSSSLGGYGGYSKPRYKTPSKPSKSSYLGESSDFSSGCNKSSSSSNSKKTSNIGPLGPSNTQFTQDAAGLAAAITEQTGEGYADKAKNALASFVGAAGATKGADGLYSGYDPMKAAEALIGYAKGGTAAENALAKQENKALSKALKYSLGSYDYGGKTFLGLGDGFTLGDETKNILRAADTYGQLPRDKTFLEKAADFSITGLLSKFFGGKQLEDMSLEELKQFYDMQDQRMAEEEARRRRGGGGGDGGSNDQTQEDTTDDEDESDDEYPFFGYRRKIQVPLSLEDIMSRYYSSDPDRKNILEDLGAAVKRRDDS